MRVIDKLLVIGFVFALLYAMYMVFGNKQIIYKTFWRSYYYLLMYSLPLAVFVAVLPLAYNAFTVFVVWSFIIFFAELVIFNLFLVNKEGNEWVNYCTSELFGYVFAVSIALLLIISIFIELFHK
jgi:hypothetical protein